MVELQARLARRRTEGAERLRRRRSRNREVTAPSTTLESPRVHA